jgi:hypothetical protein
MKLTNEQREKIRALRAAKKAKLNNNERNASSTISSVTNDPPIVEEPADGMVSLTLNPAREPHNKVAQTTTSGRRISFNNKQG